MMARVVARQHRGLAQLAVSRRKPMNLSAMRTEQADRKLLNVRQAFQVGIDAADDIATGKRTRENQRTHLTIFVTGPKLCYWTRERILRLRLDVSARSLTFWAEFSPEAIKRLQ